MFRFAAACKDPAGRVRCSPCHCVVRRCFCSPVHSRLLLFLAKVGQGACWSLHLICAAVFLVRQTVSAPCSPAVLGFSSLRTNWGRAKVERGDSEVSGLGGLSGLGRGRTSEPRRRVTQSPRPRAIPSLPPQGTGHSMMPGSGAKNQMGLRQGGYHLC